MRNRRDRQRRSGNTTAEIVAHNRTTVPIQLAKGCCQTCGLSRNAEQIEGYDLEAILYKHGDDICAPEIARRMARSVYALKIR